MVDGAKWAPPVRGVGRERSLRRGWRRLWRTRERWRQGGWHWRSDQGLWRWRRPTAGVSAAAATSTVREQRPRYLLKGRGRGRVVTQRRFGPTSSSVAQSAATFKVAASGAAHEHLSPTAGLAKRVVSMGQSGGCEVGKGGAQQPRRGCEVAGRAQAGGAKTTCVRWLLRAREGGWGAHLLIQPRSPCPLTAPGRSRPRGA